MNGENEERPRRNASGGSRATVAMLGLCIGTVLFAYAAFAATRAAPASRDPATIQQLIFVFRHGERTPTETYPTDPYRNYQWPGGWGALTKEGMWRMYRIGRWIRDVYGTITGASYRSDASLSWSSYADRCIMSAQALLAALYPPTDDEQFAPGLAWRPVPVHSTPRHLDKTITVKAPCPRLAEALERAYANESASLESPSAEYYRRLSEYTGQSVRTITDVEFLYNTLEIEERNGFELPEWTKGFYGARMREIAARSLAIFTSDPLQRRLRGGPLLKEILQRIHAFRNGTDSRRVYLYSAHDVTLVNLLRTMGFVGEYFKPDYGAILVFEVRASAELAEDAELRLMYADNTDAIEPRRMRIPNCADPCLLRDATNLWRDVLPDDWDLECRL